MPTFYIGQKVKLRDGQTHRCSATNRREREYFVVESLHSDGDIYAYSAYTKDGTRIGSCSGCIRGWVESYDNFNQGMKMNTNQLKTGDKLNVTEVLVALPAGSRSSAQVGEKFVLVSDGYSARKFTIVELSCNDNSGVPEFKYDANGNTNWISWENLAEIPASLIKAEKPSVTNTATYYSDGVKVSETHVEFDGKNWERTELETMIKRYQEVLRRPFATVAPVAITPKKTRAPRVKKADKSVVASKTV